MLYNVKIFLIIEVAHKIIVYIDFFVAMCYYLLKAVL